MCPLSAFVCVEHQLLPIILKTGTLSNLQMILLLFHYKKSPAIDDFSGWCKVWFLNINVARTNEKVTDLKQKSHPPLAASIHGQTVQTVTKYKDRGTISDNEQVLYENVLLLFTNKVYQTIPLYSLATLQLYHRDLAHPSYQAPIKSVFRSS